MAGHHWQVDHHLTNLLLTTPEPQGVMGGPVAVSTRFGQQLGDGTRGWSLTVEKPAWWGTASPTSCLLLPFKSATGDMVSF